MLLIALCTRHSFGTTRSLFERVGLPTVQGKCMTDLYVTCSTEACAAGCTEDLYARTSVEMNLKMQLSLCSS
jgi:hypothetical protein